MKLKEKMKNNNHKKFDKKKLIGTISKKHIKNGSYTMVMSVIFIAVVVVLNMIVNAIPSKYSEIDISSQKLYSIGDDTKAMLKDLDKDVTIYQIAQSGSEDENITNLLKKYEDESKHIKVEQKDPVVNPKFVTEYTSDDLSANSLIVVCGDRNKVIDYNNIYESTIDYQTYSSQTTGFDGEGQITSAIGYVTSEDLPILYTLEGHGEKEMDSTIKEDIEKANMDIQSLNLLTEGSVPDDADCLMIVSPTSDISEEEKNMLEDYFNNGGKLLVMAGPVESGDLPNLYSLLSDYGVKSDNGVVVDTDHDHYAFQAPYILMPTIESSDITDPLLDESYYAIVPIARGLEVGNTDKDVNVTSLLTTSDEAYSKVAGYNLTTYDKEDGDTDGPFALGVDITQDENDGQMIWYASSYLVDDTYNSYSSGANLDLVMNSISSLVGQRDAVSIRSKSLQYNYLTISDSTSSILKLVMIGVFPIVYLAVGIAIVVKRRRANEAN